jgi:ABC-type transport system involved in cytochrome bd biosynthesis fused ATPase/permease subunit
VKHKVDELMKMWTNLRAATLQRNKQLEDTLELSERFWDDVNGLMSTLKDLQETLYAADPPGVDPETIREQRDVLEVCFESLVF